MEMKVKILARNPEEYVRETKRDIHKGTVVLLIIAQALDVENVQTFALINDARGNSAGIHVQARRVTYNSLIKLFNVSVSDQA